MARFLMAVWPIPGHYYPNLAIAKVLQKLGHEVAFFSGKRGCAAIEPEGFHCFSFRHIDEGRLESIFFAPEPRYPWWKHRLAIQRARYYRFVVEGLPEQVPDLEAVLQQWTPDVLVCDPALWAPFLVLREKYNLKLAIFAYIPFCTLPGPNIPPLGLGLPIPRTLLSRIRSMTAKAFLQLGTVRFRSEANALRRTYGLTPIKVSVTEYAGSAPLYLIAGSRVFDYNRQDLPPSVHYVGPCSWERPRTERRPAWLGSMSRSKPWVHVSEGTVHTKAPILLSAAVKGLANLPMQVILGVSTDRPEQLGLGPVAPNIIFEHWTNIHFSDLFPLLAVLITNGGGGTVMAALQAGVPMVVIPTDWDKPEIAQRVVEAGAGVRLSQRQCTPSRLRAAVEQLLNDSSYRKNARRLASSFRNYGGPSQAAALLEKLAVCDQ